MSQAELCQKTKIPKSALSEYLKGLYEPKQDRLLIMSEALNVDPVWLMGYDEPQTRFDTYRPMLIEHSITDGLNEKSLERLKSYADYLRSMQEDKDE